MTAPAQIRRRQGALVVAWFLVDFDLAVLNPLLLPATGDLHASLASVSWALTAYLLLFGLMQPVYGLVSDRFGRVRVLWAASLAWAVANLIACLAPNVGVLIAGRALAGGCAAAIVPVTAAYVGDRFPLDRLQRVMVALLSASAVGAAAATIAAGALGQFGSWRFAIGVAAVAAAALAFAVRPLPETGFTPNRLPVATRLSQAVAPGWLRFLIAFLFVEGAAMVGFYNFFNAGMQVRGVSVLVAGAVTSGYGVAAVAGGLLVRARLERWSPVTLFGGGATVLAAGYLIAAYDQSPVAILAASVCAGLALSIGQSTAQTWVLRVAPPQARGAATSLVACSVFTGAAVGVAAITGLVGGGHFGRLFLIAAGTSIVVAIVGSVALARFQRQMRPQEKAAV